MGKCCGNCEFKLSPWNSGYDEWTCNNEDSENYGLEIDYMGCCDEFVEQD